MGADIDVLIVGGGIVGLAIARAYLQQGREVVLVERHGRLGSETSSRNSEVIHAGIYYPPGSLRARMCVAGRQMLYAFAAENGVMVRRYGKLLVATSEAERPRLEAIMTTARQNGVDDLRPMTKDDVRVLEPELNCVAACLSPSTGVLDSHGLMVALEGHVATLGGTIVLATTATRLSQTADGLIEVELTDSTGVSTLNARLVVLAAGHGVTDLMSSMAFANGYCVPVTYPAKGHYYSLRGASPFRHLVYPMPQGAWLGLHLTLDVAGRARFGPDIEWQDTVSYAFDDPDGKRQQTFEREIRRYWPGLPEDALQPDYTGVRPKIYRPDEPVADFRIDGPSQHGIDGLVALYGIESPGLTSCLALAEHVAAVQPH
jgi:L-2-hydroxyglutarate oxidase LhgO